MATGAATLIRLASPLLHLVTVCKTHILGFFYIYLVLFCLVVRVQIYFFFNKVRRVAEGGPMASSPSPPSGVVSLLYPSPPLYATWAQTTYTQVKALLTMEALVSLVQMGLRRDLAFTAGLPTQGLHYRFPALSSFNYRGEAFSHVVVTTPLFFSYATLTALVVCAYGLCGLAGLCFILLPFTSNPSIGAFGANNAIVVSCCGLALYSGLLYSCYEIVVGLGFNYCKFCQ